jgi:hypothetical protein
MMAEVLLSTRLKEELMSEQSDAERMEVSQVLEGATHAAQRRPVIRALAAAGIVGPILFTVAFIVQGLFRLDEYSAVAEPVSALEAGPGAGFSR